MNYQYHSDDVTRQMHALKIESRLFLIASEAGITIRDVAWNLGQGMAHCLSHRLDFIADGTPVKIYIPEQDLMNYADYPEYARLDTRLIDAIEHARELSAIQGAWSDPASMESVSGSKLRIPQGIQSKSP